MKLCIVCPMAPARPPDLFDREHEWSELSTFISDPTPGLRVGIVYGRRRQGKSFLLRRLAAATGGFYYQALEHEPAQALADLGERVGAHLGVGRLAFATWDEALSSIRRLAGALGGGGPAAVILDEFPYLLERSPELLSLLQRAVDRSAEEGGPGVRLILCGSAISTMAGLLHGQSPLRGRVVLNVLIRPFDHLDSRRFWNLGDPRVALRIHAILGGTPGYRDLVRSVPASLDQFDSWVVGEVLSPASALFHEDEWLLGEERGIENRAIYQSVLTAIAGGRTTEAAIARQLRRSQQSVQHPLRALVESGLLRKDEDVLRQRRPLYRIAEPVVRFHQVVRRPRTALFEDGRGVEAWADARQSFEYLVLAPHFEQLARDYVRRAGERTFGAPLLSVGTTVVSDRSERTGHQVDIVALGSGGAPGERVVSAIGQARLRELGTDDLEELERLRTTLPDAQAARLVLVSASGFAPDLQARAETTPGIHLARLEQIYAEE